MPATNERAFDMPGTLQRAMGFGRPGLIGGAGGKPGKTGGITGCQRVELVAGSSIVRFGQKRLTPNRTSLSARGLFSGAAEGEWWLEQDQFDRVERYATEQRIEVGAAVGALCVVPEEWSDLDIVIFARLKSPLLAYRGSPNPATVRGRLAPKLRDNHNYLIKQLFVPGLANGDVLHDALMIERQVFLHQKARH